MTAFTILVVFSNVTLFINDQCHKKLARSCTLHYSFRGAESFNGGLRDGLRGGIATLVLFKVQSFLTE